MSEQERSRRREPTRPEPPSSQELLARCVAAIERGETDIVAKICAEHPEHEAALRLHLSRLGHMGMVSQSEEVAGHSVEARLQNILELPRSSREAALAALCREHPELAAGLRERYDLVVRLRALGPRAAATRTGAATADTAPDTIGPYRILGVLGEGGMGTVFLAEQREPVRRRVALKVIKLGMDTKQILARFQTERQTLAMMEHDCIARVLDAGATGDGRPYFVMEYVKGAPITDYCDAQRLRIPERLALFRQVCAGVQHAHQKGVIHRDLKPSNVLVTLQSGQPVPKIIDFGLARATYHHLVEATLYTELGQMLGTPEYMSPEQAQVGSLDIDTRTDIYSLGVLLYELLTGALPFHRRELHEAGLHEIQRRIREEDPPKPSTRLTTLGEASREQARKRRTDLRSLASSLRGDLDWITMKALEKDRTRRYGSVEALAEDLRRHLEHEPVDAGPPSGLYRLRKFLRKRRGPVAAGVAVFLALAGGMATAWWQYGVAKDNETAAKKNETRALKAERDAKQTAAELGRALAAYRRMQDVPLAEDLIREADAVLCSAHVDKVVLIDDWLSRARSLGARADAHREELAALRRRALPPTPGVQRKIDDLDAQQKERDAKAAKLARARKAADKSRAARAAVPKLQQELKGLEARLSERKAELRDARWRFDSYEDRFLHATFAGLVANLDKLTGGLIDELATRREQAATLRERSIEDRREDWQRAVARVAASEKYRDTPALTPQLGLVPLGPDPDSQLEEFAALDTGAVPPRDASGRLQIDGESAIVLVLIPPGTFRMGAQASDPTKPNHDRQAQRDESPVCEVALDAFFLAKYEMTQGQWQRLMGTNPSVYPAGTRDVTLQNPVEHVSWDDCQEALRRLGFELPTEAQWEYAARAGASSVWWTGNEKSSLQGAANVADRCFAERMRANWSYEHDLDDGYALHAPVGSFRANDFGLHDVIGNIMEWCRDEYGPYGREPRPGDGLRLHTGALSRVYRGGCWSHVARTARSAEREMLRPDVRGNAIGCRPSSIVTR